LLESSLDNRRRKAAFWLPRNYMNPNTILYPGIAMFGLTLFVMLRLGFARYTAIQSRSVSIKYFRTYNEGEQPARLHLLSRHMQNHFEVPPLFYAGLIFTYVSGAVTVLAIVMAWLFFFARCIHSYIHLGSNNVSARFFTFGASLAFLTGLWGTLLIQLVRSAA
jgi:hypothetical protein